MPIFNETNFADRRKSSLEAKQALLAKMKVKPTVTDPDFENRHAGKEVELERVRAERVAEKEATRRARLEAAETLRKARNSQIKERKASTRAEQQSRKEARMNEWKTLSSGSNVG
jgi:hypothetical protein